MSSIRLSAAAILAATTALGGCVVSLDSQGYTNRETRTFDVSANPDVRLTTFDGSIQIRTWDKDQVQVEIEKRAPTDEALKALEVVATQSGNRVQVEVRRPSGGESFFGIGNFSRSAKIVATLPRKASVVASSGDGSIRVEGVSGRCELRTGDGSVRGSDIVGDVTVHTGDGSVTLQDVTGAVDLSTGDGGVSLSGVLGGVQVDTGDGSVTVRADDDSRMSGDWSLRTGDGSVVLYLPSGFAADLDAHTSDGSVTSDHDVTTTVSGRIDKKTLKGRLGEGGHTLKVRTGDGSIRLRVS